MTPAKTDATSTATPKRMQARQLWKLLVVALLAHLALALLLSSALGGRASADPAAQLTRARALRAENKHDAALEAYQMVVSQKPPVPAIFLDAEKELLATRLEGLEAKRKAAATQRQADAAAAPVPAPDVATNAAGPAPAVALPALPALDGGL